jgi:glycosyltransferase involved in cell wall biosynthesis
MKKILIVVPSLKKGGGAEKVSAIVGSKLSRFYDVFFLTLRDTGPKYDFTGNYITLNENNSSNPFNVIFKLFIRTWKIKKACKENDIELVISHMEEASIPSLFSKLFLKNKIKLIITIHNNPIFKNYLYRLIIRYFYRFADTVVAITKSMEVMLIVFLEAMAYGLPIIANNFPSFQEIIGKNNFVSANQDDFAKNLEKIIDDAVLRKKTSNSNRETVRNYNIKEIIFKWQYLLKDENR